MIKLSEENLAKINNNSLKKSSEVPEDDHRSIVDQTLPENIHGELAEPNTQFDLVNFSFLILIELVIIRMEIFVIWNILIRIK